MRWILLALLVLTAGGTAGYWYDHHLDDQIQGLKDQVKRWDDKITLIKSDVPRHEKLSNDLAAGQATIRVLPGFVRQVHTDTQRTAHLLEAVQRAVPPSVQLTHVELQPGGQVLGFDMVRDDVPCGGAPMGPPLLLVTTRSTRRPALARFQQALAVLSDRIEGHDVPGGMALRLQCRVLP